MSPTFYIVLATINAVPATIAAIAALRTGKRTASVQALLATSNDLTVAEMVEDSHAKLSREDRDFDKHHPSAPKDS